MNLKDKKYIESDLDGILATLATLLNFNLEDLGTVEETESEERIKSVIEKLLFIHKNYNLIKK